MRSCMSKRALYQERMGENLEAWERRLEALIANGGAPLASEPQGWRTAGQAGLAKLTELRAASGDHWDIIKLDMERIWYSMQVTLDTVEALRRARAVPAPWPSGEPEPV
jgi:hypothetical protein